MKKAIITGISGQDGAYLTQLLLSKGYQVIGITRNHDESNFVGLKYLGLLDKVTLLGTDLLNKQSVIQLLEEFWPDEIYNLAAQSSVGASFGTPIETIHFNTLSVVNILEAIRFVNHPIRFYQASSSEMFGDIKEKNLPIKETLLFHPTSPYGISKVAAHWIAVNYRETYGIFASCGILFNHESCLRGKYYVTKKIIRTAILIQQGKLDTLSLGNLDIERDWGYAPSYVDVIYKIVQHSEPTDFLVCSGEHCTLRTFVEKAFFQLGLDYTDHVKVEEKLFRKNDLPIIYGSNEKAKQELNWDYAMDIDSLISSLLKDERAFMAWENSL